MTQHAPPTPPEMKDLSAESEDDFGCSALQHSCCGVDSALSSVVMIVVLLGISVAVDILSILYIEYGMKRE